jgi:hypothetical protein
MKSLIVYWADNRWYGSEIEWKRSGSGTYRETRMIEIPQSRAEIEKFAQEKQYSIEWRKPLPAESPSAGSVAH